MLMWKMQMLGKLLVYPGSRCRSGQRLLAS